MGPKGVGFGSVVPYAGTASETHPALGNVNGGCFLNRTGHETNQNSGRPVDLLSQDGPCQWRHARGFFLPKGGTPGNRNAKKRKLFWRKKTRFIRKNGSPRAARRAIAVGLTRLGSKPVSKIIGESARQKILLLGEFCAGVDGFHAIRIDPNSQFHFVKIDHFPFQKSLH